MPRDLKYASDHPAIVMTQHANVTVMVGHTAAVALRKYELEAGVTFAALDDDALAAVREAYSRKTDAYGIGAAEQHAILEGYRLQDLESAVRDLLGLED